MTERSGLRFEHSSILITGATGFLGEQTLLKLDGSLPGSSYIHVLARKSSPRTYSARVIWDSTCDGLSLTDVQAEKVDYVIWMAANRNHFSSFDTLFSQNVTPVIAAIDKLRLYGRIKRFVYVSSVSAVDHAVNDNLPIMDSSSPSPSTPYGITKRMAEEILLNSTIPITILRLPFLYGPNYKTGSFLDWLQWWAERGYINWIPLPGRLSLLYTGDFADMVLRVIEAEDDAGSFKSLYTVSDGNIYRIDLLKNLIIETRTKSDRRRFFRRRAMDFFSTVGDINSFAYWSKAAFSDYFVVDSSGFRSRFPEVCFTELRSGLSTALSRE